MSCQHCAPRFGSAIEHGTAHRDDHERWTRRNFIRALGLAAGGTPLMAAGWPMQAFGGSAALNPLRRVNSDRILVLIQLFGGNDGLNTIVPIRNDRYYQLRPTLHLREADTVAIPGVTDYAFHPSFSALTPMFGDGQMGILRGVGYPGPSLSHFRSTDIWTAANLSNFRSGWIGRYIDEQDPDFVDDPPETPTAVQVGVSSFLLRGPDVDMGLSLTNVEEFERLAELGLAYPVEGLPDNPTGHEIEYTRRVANDAYRYAGSIHEAAGRGANAADYPDGMLGASLAITARLIKGDLGARIYHVMLTNFDHHAEQRDPHAALLYELSESVAAFISDLSSVGRDQQVLTMTFSEFGRRPDENGSFGTDHGSAGPIFVFGSPVVGGFYGRQPDLNDLDTEGNPHFGIDFRAVYASVLQDWFELDAATVEALMGGSFGTVPFLTSGPVGVPTEHPPEVYPFALMPNYPNPFRTTTRLAYTLSEPGPVRLEVFDVQGRRMQRLVDAPQPAGRHEVVLNARDLPGGTYLMRLTSGERQHTRTLTVTK